MPDSNGSWKSNYEQKFADFIKLCDETEPGGIILVASPHALRDTYEEIIESLNRLADAEARLGIVPRAERT